VDNTGDDLVDSAKAARQPQNHPRPVADIVEKDVNPQLALKQPGWAYGPAVQVEPVITQYLTKDPEPPDYTAKTVGGRPLWTEEFFYVMKPVSFTPPALSATTLPAADKPEVAGWALSAGTNAPALFELRDAATDNSPATSVVAHLAPWYPCEGTAILPPAPPAPGWQVVSATRSAKSNFLAVQAGAHSITGTTIDSTTRTITGPVYLGGQPEVPGNYFKGCVGGLILIAKAITQQQREDCEDLLMQLAGITRDRNANGVSDLWEKNLLPPETRSALADPDNDGRNNRAEFNEGTDPDGTDSDGDSLSDSQEGLPNALKFDSDGDGFPDSTDGGRNGQWDTDLDGIPDGWPAFLAIP
jgi:hypothetical protein